MSEERAHSLERRLDADIDELIVVEHEIVERAPAEPAETLPLAVRASELVDDIEAQVAEDASNDPSQVRGDVAQG